ncbi:MAG: BatD family protein [Verrucomicrobiota bacterium]|nr:BatD family protein [Verrucomicrobiota bacterium]
MGKNLLHSKILVQVFLLLTTLSAKAQIRIEAKFQPASITLSKTSVYKIIIHGTQDNPKGNIPSIDGLNLSSSPQTFRSASFINGVPSVRLEMSFQARPDFQGTFNMPSWNIQVGGTSYRVPQASLRVLPPSQADIIEKEKFKKQQEDLKQAAFIEFFSPRSFLYAGESVTAEIKLYLWDRLPVTRIEKPPFKTGDAFSMTEIGEPNEKRNISKNNKSYIVFSWSVGLTAAMPGDHPLSFNTSIRIRASNRRTPFGNPFFNDPFFGFGREESLKVLSQEYLIQVKPLPMNGRPNDFQGAIGAFEASTEIDAKEVSVGDPLRLTLTLKGSGNFAAMPAPILETTNEFKSGPPSFSFSGNEKTMQEGLQNFEYVITPLIPGLLNTPKITFSYFDPIREKYNTVFPVLHQIQVNPGEQWDESNQISNIDEDRQELPLAKIELFQTDSEPGEWLEEFAPSPLRKSLLFWSGQSIPFLCVCFLIIAGAKRRNQKRDNLRQKEINLKRRMKESVSHNDLHLFLRTARTLIQHRIGKLHKHPNPSSLSSHELLSIIKNGRLSMEIKNSLESILKRYDDQEFAGSELSKIKLDEEFQIVSKILKSLR